MDGWYTVHVDGNKEGKDKEQASEKGNERLAIPPPN